MQFFETFPEKNPLCQIKAAKCTSFVKSMGNIIWKSQRVHRIPHYSRIHKFCSVLYPSQIRSYELARSKIKLCCYIPSSLYTCIFLFEIWSVQLFAGIQKGFKKCITVEMLKLCIIIFFFFFLP